MASTYTPGEAEIQTDSIQEPAPAASLLEGESISFLDLLFVIAKHRGTILRITGAGVVLGIVISLLLPRIYTAHTMILTPLNAPSASSALAGELGVLSSVMNEPSSLGFSDPNAVFLAMLNSETVARGVVDRFGLRDAYRERTWVATLKEFHSNLRVSSGNDGTITVEFDDKDPARAAAVANGIVDELRKVTRNNAVTGASQRRVYFGAQLEKAKNELADSEMALKKVQETTGMLDRDKQTLAIVTTLATLKGQIAAQQVRVQGLRSFATSRNPDLIRAEAELAAMRGQLTQMERSSGGGNGDIFVATKNLPASGLEFLRRYRDVKYFEELYELLAKQYEAAVVDEGTNGVIIQVVDPAMPPDRRSKPRRALVVLVCFVLAFLGACAGVIGSEVMARLALDPVQGPKLAAIRQGLSLPDGLWERIRHGGWRGRRGD